MFQDQRNPVPPTTSDASPAPAPLPGHDVKALREGLTAFLAFCAASLYFLRPIAALWRDHIAPDPGDPLFNLYVLQWGGEQIRRGLPSFWDANVFHPLDNALTLSDHLFGPAALALPVSGWTGSAVAGYNFLFLLAFALSGTTTYLVLRKSGLGPTTAALGGAVFAFAPYRWEQASHLQVIFAPWVPVVLWSFDRLLARPAWRRAALFLAFYALHVTAGNYLAFMIHFPLLALLVNRALDDPSRARWGRPGGRASLAVAAALSVAVLALIFLPYWQTHQQLDMERGAAEYRLFGASVPAYLTPSRTTAYFPVVEPALRAAMPRFEDEEWFMEKTFFPGVVATLLAAVALLTGWRRHRRAAAPAQPGSRKLALGLLLAAAATVFVIADLYTVGLVEAPGDLAGHAGWTYALLAVALAVPALSWLALRWRWGLDLPLRWEAMPVWPRGVLLGTACTFLLAFPVVFTPLAEVVPGLEGMRAPGRFYTLTLFGIAFLAAHGLDLAMRAARRRWPGARLARAGAWIVLALFLAEVAPAPFAWHPVPSQAELDPVYHWIADPSQEVGAILEVPITRGPHEAWYMHSSTLHWRPLVNGYSARETEFHELIRKSCCRPVPSVEALGYLRSAGVTHVVFHPMPRDGEERAAFDQWVRQVSNGRVEGLDVAYRDSRGTVVVDLAARPGTADG